MSEKKLFLLDAYALIYRSYYAFIKNPRINSKNLNTSAIFGFTNTLLDVIQNQKPSHIAVVFDSDAMTTREENFAAYKANREAMPEDIRISIPYIKSIIKGFNIPTLESPGYEADDIIGTLAKQGEKEGFKVFMMTPDKDFGQLVSENIFMYKPGRMGKPAEIWGVKEVCERFEIEHPLQVIDILGLMGDAVDNIPGIPGVGEKTAMKFVKEFGCVEGLLANTDKIQGKMKEKVEEGRESAIISKQLATILLDAPVPFEPEKLIIDPPNKEMLMELFNELEFRQMAQRIFKEEIEIKPKSSIQFDLFSNQNEEENITEVVAETESNQKNIENTKHKYYFLQNEEEVSDLISKLEKSSSFCFDTETTGLDTHLASLVGISFSISNGEAFYFPIPLEIDKAIEVLRPFQKVFADENIEKVGQNCKYDVLMLRKYGIVIRGKIFDTMIAHYLLEPDNRRHGMDFLAEVYLNYKPVSIESLLGPKGKNQKNMADLPQEEIKDYAAEDADITLQLKNLFEPKFSDSNLAKLFYEMETPLILVLAEMELQGINLNVESLKKLSLTLADDIAGMEGHIYELAGEKFNIASPKQVGEVLFEKLQVVEKPKKTKTGQYATSEDVLDKIKNKHEIVSKILDYRELVKLKNTYVDPLPELINPNTGRIHTSYNQVVAATGRLSSDRPNLQNIPIRTERGREIRKAFVPRDKNHILMASDYSQIELRIMAHLSGDKGMLEAFNLGQDIHAATASKVFGVAVEDVSREQRSKSKMVNFGIIYGISVFGLSERLSIPRGEAKEIIDAYFEQYPGVKSYMERTVATAKENEYVETIMGRRRWLRDINSANAVVRGHAERNAINAPIQGSAADMIKVAMIRIHEAFIKENFQSKMLLQVHDELVFDVLIEEKEVVKACVEKQMEEALKLKVPIIVESGFGNNWLEAH